jgi:hypothetical protein
MNKNLSIWVTILTVIAVCVSLLAYFRPVTVENPSNPSKPVVGAAGPDMPYTYISVNGLTTQYFHIPMNVGSSTVCSIPPPTSTSTFDSFPSAFFQTGSTTAMQIQMALAKSPYATTTVIANGIVGANATYTTLVGTTTSSINGSVVGPNDYLNVNAAGGATNVFSPTGYCDVMYQQL